MRRAIRFSAAFGLLFALSRVVLADGVILDGVTARTIGRGGTNIAFSDTGAMLHDNPSAMAFMQGEQLLEAGATLLVTDFSYFNGSNPNGLSSNGYGLPTFSYVRRSPDKLWAFGLGAFGAAGFGSSFTLDGNAAFPGPQTNRSFGALVKLLPGIAYQATDQLSFGITLGGGFTIAELEGPYTLQSAPLTGLPTRMSLHADGVALVWSAGMMYRLAEDLTLGLTYTSDSRFHAKGNTTVEVPNLGTSVYDTTVDITWPQSVGLGAKYDLCQCRTISADLIWFGWGSAFDDFGIHLTNPSVQGFPTTTEQFPLNWRDTVSARLGYQQQLDDERTIRLGYVYHRVPIPANTMTPFIPAALEHAFSAGYGQKFGDWYVDLAYMFSFGPQVDTNASAFVGGDYDNSISIDRTHAAALSFMRRW